MKKSNSLIKFTTFVLLITIVAIVLVSGTYARYTSTASGTDTATVAKWSFKVGGTDIAGTTEKTGMTFDIFSTLKGADATTAEANVKTKDGSMIAPGTGGSFKIALENTSDVTAEYRVVYTIEKNTDNIPLEFSKDGSTWSKNISSITQDYTEIAIGAKADTTTVYWRWSFEGSDSTDYKTTQTDETDTTLGIKGSAASVQVKATIEARQVD
ncbi:MAG: hypothetical protein IJ777_00560 [Clostridia bacterium]|nr:hypothetical protein [Clostridia bacterium]